MTEEEARQGLGSRSAGIPFPSVASVRSRPACNPVGYPQLCQVQGLLLLTRCYPMCTGCDPPAARFFCAGKAALPLTHSHSRTLARARMNVLALALPQGGRGLCCWEG